MYLSESLQKKWEGVLDHPDLPSIKDPYRKAVTAVVLENQAVEMQKSAGMLYETGAPTNSMGSTNGGFQGGSAAAGPVAGFDPILISLVRRSLPNLIAYDICGVQPMTGPTGLIFAMRTKYAGQSGAEAFYNEANTGFSGLGTSGNNAFAEGSLPTEVFTNNAAAVGAMTTARAEALGDGAAANAFQEMAFSIEKVTVTAKTRALSEGMTKDQIPTESGKYKIEYTIDNGSGADLDVVNVSQSDIDDANNFGTSSLNFWKGLVDNNLFGRGDRVMNVEKIA